jgi:hypothetical protein
MICCKLVEQSARDAPMGAGKVGRAVSGETLSMGRAASCKVYMPDPSIRLDHASIIRAEDGGLYLQANGTVLVDQQPHTKIRLAVGQSIVLGPYQFHVDSLEDGRDQPVASLTLSYVRDAVAAVDGLDLARAAEQASNSGVFKRRRMAWVLALLVLVFCAALPIWTAYQPAAQAPVATQTPMSMPAALPIPLHGMSLAKLDTFWNPGKVSSAHQNFGNDCRQCHDKPFSRVADASCETCHKTVGAHITSDKNLQRSTFEGQRCASCHREHQGLDAMHKVDAMGCVQCHGSIKRYAPQSALGDIADFADSHSDFKLTLVQLGKPASVKRMTQEPALKNPTGLKFPHDVHLAKAGIKSPQGLPTNQGRVVMECVNCHALDSSGAGFAPVKMEQHCQSCHQLAVDPQAPQRQVAHRKPAEVAQAVRDIYSTLAVERNPADLVTVNSLLQRPGVKPVVAKAGSAARWVQDQTQIALVGMMERPKGVCLTCHTVTLKPAADGQSPGWEIGGIALTKHWLPKSTFSHAKHKNAACSDCHTPEKSKDSGDILIPDIASCRTCHAGAKPDNQKVVSTCASCHGFHSEVVRPVFMQNALAVKAAS